MSLIALTAFVSSPPIQRIVILLVYSIILNNMQRMNFRNVSIYCPDTDIYLKTKVNIGFCYFMTVSYFKNVYG